MSTCIIVPIKNESDQLDELFTLIEQYPKDIKIYFSDGGCTDDSFIKINNFAKNKNTVFTCKDSSEKKSILSTILAPIEEIKEDYILIHPADIDCSTFIEQLSDYNHSDYYVFYKEYTPSRSLLKLQEFVLNEIRLKIFKSFVWTNGPIVKTKVLKECKSLRNDFLEDVLISDYLKQKFQGTIIKKIIKCSSRRYIHNGTFTQFIINIFIMILFRIFKINPSKLKSIYYKIK